MRKLITISIIMLLFLTANATVQFYDDFNREDGAVGNDWLTYGSAVNTIESNRCKSIFPNSFSGLYRDFDAQTDTIYFEFEWVKETTGSMIKFYPATNARNEIFYLIYGLPNDNSISYDTDPLFGSPTQITTVNIGETANVKIEIDIPTNEFSIWINEDSVIGITGNSISDINQVYFRNILSSSVTQYIDNFIFYNDNPPDTPQNLTATENVSNITLNWDSVPDSLFVTYKIYRDESSPAATYLEKVDSPTLT